MNLKEIHIGNLSFYILILIWGILFGMLSERYIIQPLAGKTYKQGQIDYANNIIKYKLEKQSNGEMIWKEIKKGKE